MLFVKYAMKIITYSSEADRKISGHTKSSTWTFKSNVNLKGKLSDS